MAITFAEREKRQRNLIFVFVGVILITFLILYLGYFRKTEAPPPEVSPPILPKKVEINFGVFQNPLLEKLQIFEKIEPAKEEEIGRENPFTSY